MSFAQELADTADKRAKAIQDYKIKKMREFEAEKSKREDELMKKLTTKYHPLIKEALWNSALICGNREKYMNLDYNDFKANFPELGKPAEVCHRWLTEMTKEDSPYVPYKLPIVNFQPISNGAYGWGATHYDSNWAATNYDALASLADGQYNVSEPPKKDHFAGLKFSVWNNRAFTVHFTW